MSKVKNISGFPEWLPKHKLVEDGLILQISKLFKSYGFTPIETPAVELKSTLSSKGVIDKEIYLLRRALADSSDKDDEELALHFDLTVPFARYVAQHYNELTFPFKRYQLQKVWRGERPQRGRFREFYQFDIDIIAREVLPIACDAEVLAIIDQAFKLMPIGPSTIRLNNRKILLGFYESINLDSKLQKEVLIAVDKLDKIQIAGVEKELEKLSITREQISSILKATELRCGRSDVSRLTSSLGCNHPLYLEGVEEMQQIMNLLPEANVLFDLSLARGLDYYTGSIFEIALQDHPEYGTVSSGGRYENLASEFINKKLPGVGVSIGLSRIMDLIVKKGLCDQSRLSPTELLVTVYNEEQRSKANAVAQEARNCGMNVEVFLSSPKLGKQIEYADSKGIPFVAFIDENTRAIKVKEMSTKNETTVENIREWCTGKAFE